MEDLYTICIANTGNLEARFELVLNGSIESKKRLIQEFSSTVDAIGKISINMRPNVLLAYLIERRLVNVHEWAQEVSARGGRPVDELKRERLRNYYQRRIAFDGFFFDGFRFKYGALNIGGLGADKYGEYCLIVKREVCSVYPGLVYLIGDSLKCFMKSDDEINLPKVQADSAPDSHKHLLAVVKHERDLDACEKEDWPALVCNDVVYIEAIFTDSPRIDQVERIRIASKDLALNWDYAYRNITGTLSELEKVRLEMFILIDKQLAALGLEWEPV